MEDVLGTWDRRKPGKRRHTAPLAPHRQVTPAGIPLQRLRRRQLGQDVPHAPRRTEYLMRPVHGKCEHEDNDDDHQPVDVVGFEGRFDTTEECICDDTDMEEEDGGFDRGPG